jgi:hypothetical protein
MLNNLVAKPVLHEASGLHSAREPESTQHLWKFVNDCADGVNANSQNINQLNRVFQSLNQKGDVGNDMYPFKVYVTPDIFRGGPSPNNWCTVCVRGGYVLNKNVATASFVNGTDRCEYTAYGNIYPNTSGSYIYLTGSVDQNPTWIWIETLSSSYNIRYSNTPTVATTGNPNPWTGFPLADSTHIPVALVDTYTSSSISQAIIRQFLTCDVLLSGGGSGSAAIGWNWRGLWTATPPSPYMSNDVTSVNSNPLPGIYWNYLDNNNNVPQSGIGWSSLWAQNIWQ